ncbi:kinase-like domain-containing protein [Scleroderma yunnanense]
MVLYIEELGAQQEQGWQSRFSTLALRQVLHEMQRWSILEHENVLQLLGITTMYEQTLSLVTVWMEKGNAHDYVQDQTVDPRPLVAGISRGLQYLHNCKPPIIHGDLKGSNVLISGQGHPLLTDYGLSGLVTASFSVSVSASRSSALNWMAPETMKSETYEVTVKGDVWAFGMTALELFTREVPFSDKKGLLEVRNRVQEGPPDRPRNESTHSRMTDEWWNICSLCWKNQEHRPDISAVISEIEQIAQKPPVKDDITGNEKTTMEPQRSHVETVPPRSSLWVRLRRIFCCG